MGKASQRIQAAKRELGIAERTRENFMTTKTDTQPTAATEANRAAGGDCPRTPCCASLIVHDPSDLPKCDGEILVALWGAGEWEIVNVRENINGPFAAEYKSTGELADPSEWQWWADLHCMILHNDQIHP